MILCFFDGRCEPNPNGISSYGVIVKVNGKEVLREGKYIGRGQGQTNNLAEYAGCIRVLDFLIDLDMGGAQIIVRGDSQLVIQQMSGKWNIDGGAYMEKALEAKKKVEVFSEIKFEWIPKEENWECDKLASEAVREIKNDDR